MLMKDYKSQIKSNLYTIHNFTNLNCLMQQIKAKVKQFTKPSTKKGYEKAIKYLLDITEFYSSHSPINLKNQMNSNTLNHKDRKFYSVDNNKKRYSYVEVSQKKKEIMIGSQNGENSQQQQQVFYDCFSGSQLSFIQKINEKMKQLDQNQKQKSDSNNENDDKQRRPKLDRRKLQQTIEIYHQCLEKTLQILKLQHIEIIKFIKQQKLNRKIDQFWQNFIHYKKQCKTFNDLIYLVHNYLAKQFKTAIKPYAKTIKNISIKLISNQPRIVCIQSNK